MRIPKSQIEFERMFTTEEQCIKYLMELRFPEGYSTNKGYKRVIQDNTKVLDGEEILPNVHRIASLLKRWLLATHQNYIGDDYLSYYLDEYTFRYNRRKSNSRGLLFQRFVEQVVTHEHVEYKLIKRM